MRRVYFIRPIGMESPVKVGSSVSPDGRRETLETWSPFPLEVIAEIEGGYEIERRFHALFRDTYQRREWFDWSPLIAETVTAINTGTFDVATLPAPQRLGLQYLQRKPWTDEQRLRASYSHRITNACRRTGKRFPHHIHHASMDDTWRDLIPEMDAFLAEVAAA